MCLGALRLVSVLVALAIFDPATAAQDVDRDAQSLSSAVSSYQAGNFEESRPLFEELAERGSASALFHLGRMYQLGEAVEADPRRALDFFTRATELGEVNAPVWAGQLLEAQGDIPAAAEMHRIAISRGAHITSVLALARYHRNSLISDANDTAAARYYALNEAILRRYEIASDLESLSIFSCYELLVAYFVELRSQSDGDGLSIEDYYPEYFDCMESGDRSTLQRMMVSTAFDRLETTDSVVIDESLNLFSMSRSSGNENVSILPSPFAGRVAFASDADADRVSASLSMHAYLNDQLGLPIASSIYVTSSSMEAGRPSTGAQDDPAILMSIFNGVDELNTAPVFGLPAYFRIAREWHRGRYDHLHSWFSDGQTFLMRGPWPIEGDQDIPLTELLTAPLERHQRAGLVLRLYFTGQPPEDLQIAFRTFDGRSFAVNSADLVNHQRIELDEGEQRYVIVLTLPSRYPMFAIGHDEVIASSEIAAMSLSSPSCGQPCGIQLVKLELNNFDREVAIDQARTLRDLRIFPMGYTSHGGEGWHVHGDPSALNAFWNELTATTPTQGTVYQSPTFATANVEGTKGYIEDLLSEIGVFAVRPERLGGGRPSSQAVHDWDEPFTLFSLYNDKLNLSTTHFLSYYPAAFTNTEARRSYFRSRLNMDEQLLTRTCIDGACDIALNYMLPLLVQASFQRAANSESPFSHIWYTHFGSPTALVVPTAASPFSEDSRRAFERLSAAFLGFYSDGRETDDERLFVSSTSEAILSRRTQFILDSGLVAITEEAGRIDIGVGLDPFSGATFPVPESAGQDLAMLTYRTDDIFSSDIHLGDAVLPVMRRRTGSPGSPAGELTVVDTSAARSVVFGDLSQPPERRFVTDWQRSGGNWVAHGVPAQSFDVFNARFIAIENPFFNGGLSGEITLEIMLRPHFQHAYPPSPAEDVRHVFSSAPGNVTFDPGQPTVVHRIDLPAHGGQQPEILYIPVFMSEGFQPGADALAGMAFSGRIVEINAVLQTRSRPETPFGPLHVLSGSRDLRSQEIPARVIGGAIDSSSIDGALVFEPEEDGTSTVIAISGNYYLGELPLDGFYNVRWISQQCGGEGGLMFHLEGNRLDFDLEVENCALAERLESQ